MPTWATQEVLGQPQTQEDPLSNKIKQHNLTKPNKETQRLLETQKLSVS